MALPIGYQPETNATPCTPQGANSKGDHFHMGPRSGQSNLYPTHVKHEAPHTAAHARPEAQAITKGARGHLQGWPSPYHCTANRLPRIQSCPYANTRGSHSTTPLGPCFPSNPILYGRRKKLHATQGSREQIPQRNNRITRLLRNPGIGRRHSSTPKLMLTPQPPQTIFDLK